LFTDHSVRIVVYPEIGRRWHLGAGAESLELLSVNPLPSRNHLIQNFKRPVFIAERSEDQGLLAVRGSHIQHDQATRV
jgi:hypothetical protein